MATLTVELARALHKCGVVAITRGCEPPYIKIKVGKHWQKTKIGKVLAKTFSNEEVKNFVNGYRIANNDFSIYTVKIATNKDYDLWRLAYNESNINSCMSGQKDSDIYELEPFRVYLYDERIKLFTVWLNKVCVARCILFKEIPTTKWYIEIGTGRELIKEVFLESLLKKHCVDSRTNLVGAKLAKIEKDNNYIMPYIDGSDIALVEKEDYFLVVYSDEDIAEYSCQETSGFVGKELNTCICENCGERFNNNETGWYTNDHGIYCSDSCLMGDGYFVDEDGHIVYLDDFMERLKGMILQGGYSFVGRNIKIQL